MFCATAARKNCSLVINCHEQLVNPEYIEKALKWAKTEYGPENVHAIEILVSDYTMAADGWMLIQWGFERRIIANDKSGLHCWHRVFRNSLAEHVSEGILRTAEEVHDHY